MSLTKSARKLHKTILIAGLIAIALSACGGGATPQPTPPAAAPATSAPQAGYPDQEIPQPQGSYPAPADQSPAEQSTLPAQPSYPAPEVKTGPTQTLPAVPPARGIVVYDKAAGVFHVFSVAGTNQNQDLSAQGLDIPGPNDVRVVGQSVYYYSNQDRVVYKAGASGPQALEFTRAASAPTGFAVSADESQIAWSKDDLQASPAFSELWVAGIDGSNGRMVARNESQDGSPGFLVMRPYRWTADGKLLYEQQPVGIGGYILFAGLNSLYQYDPASNAITTVFPPGPNPNLCLAALFPGDLSRGVFSCFPGEKNGLTFRRLPDGSLIQAVPPVEDQGTTGSAVFSPDGNSLAYAVARNDPNQEHGQVVVVPTDLSSAPKSIASVEPGYFSVAGWASPAQILFQRYENDRTSVWKVNSDGSDAAKIADGWFVDLIR
ncbi:MAG TPA: hypothetical protein VMT46_17850 [Anaerolineaceae bacterium]|nr:hypothetical protein [Anaerolineaceae bacterium]